MRLILLLFIHNIPATLCAVAAGVLAYNGRDGWGWFLVVTALTCAIRVNTGEGK